MHSQCFLLINLCIRLCHRNKIDLLTYLLAWRKAAGGGGHWTGSSDEEGGEEKEKQEEGSGEVGKEKKAGGSGPVFQSTDIRYRHRPAGGDDKEAKEKQEGGSGEEGKEKQAGGEEAAQAQGGGGGCPGAS